MRKEATLEQWQELYELAAKIKELQPWETFWDMDLIGIREGAQEDTIFYSILGHNGECYGIAVYEGYESFNSYLMLASQKSLHLPAQYAMYNQENLTCYWGDREELSTQQRKIIKELGLKFRGKNQWPYFMSFQPGYYPFQMDQDEALRMIGHMKNLEKALQRYSQESLNVNFEKGNMYLFERAQDGETWESKEAPLPFLEFQMKKLVIQDDSLLSDLAETGKCDAVLEADIVMPGIAFKDKKFERPVNPSMCVIGDAMSETILKFELAEPEDDPIAILAEEIITFIFTYGAPKEIRVSNAIVEAGLEHICQSCGIKLRTMNRLPGLEEFLQAMRREM